MPNREFLSVVSGELTKYTLSWFERVTIPIPCWWRKLLGLRQRTVSVFQRFSLGLDTLGKISFLGRGTSFVCVEQTAIPTQYIDGNSSEVGYQWTGIRLQVSGVEAVTSIFPTPNPVFEKESDE